MTTPSSDRVEAWEVNTLAEQIQTLILEKLLVPVESTTADLFRTGVLDSMGLVQLPAHIEENFQLRLPVDQLDLDSFRSVLQIAQLVANGKEFRLQPESE